MRATLRSISQACRSNSIPGVRAGLIGSDLATDGPGCALVGRSGRGDGAAMAALPADVLSIALADFVPGFLEADDDPLDVAEPEKSRPFTFSARVHGPLGDLAIPSVGRRVRARASARTCAEFSGPRISFGSPPDRIQYLEPLGSESPKGHSSFAASARAHMEQGGHVQREGTSGRCEKGKMSKSAWQCCRGDLSGPTPRPAAQAVSACNASWAFMF